MRTGKIPAVSALQVALLSVVLGVALAGCGQEVAVYRSVKSPFVPTPLDSVTGDQAGAPPGAEYVIYGGILHLRTGTKHVTPIFLAVTSRREITWDAQSLQRLLANNPALRDYLPNGSAKDGGVVWIAQ